LTGGGIAASLAPDRPADNEAPKEGPMAMEIKLLSLIDIELESSFLVLARNMGIRTRVHTWGCLILGNEVGPFLVDTGARDTEIMGRLHMTGFIEDGMGLESQLARPGLELGDVRSILHTHLHIDHAGGDERFPMSTTVVINRRELEYSVSGLMGEQYPAEYVKHLVDRLHTPGALRLLDLELSGPDEIFPGVVCEAAGGHTEGSMNILVDLVGGERACICGDVLYDVQNQVVDPIWQVLDYEPQTTGNHGNTKRQEKAAIKKALNSGNVVIPIHDFPARVRGSKIVSRFGQEVPGPEIPVDHRTTGETGEMGLGGLELEAEASVTV
jgi:glyoxylase-like metal-dependent hydrolase (beta-lactamase superfamily II)